MISICLWDALNIALPIYVPHSNLHITKSTGALNNFASSIGITRSSSDYDGVQTEPSGAGDDRDIPWVSASRGARKWALFTFPTRIQMKLAYLCDHGNPKITPGTRRADGGNLVSIGPTSNDGSNPSRDGAKLNSPVDLAVSQTTTAVGSMELDVIYTQSPSASSATSVISFSEIGDGVTTAAFGDFLAMSSPTPSTFSSVTTQDGTSSTTTSTNATMTSNGSGTHFTKAIIGGVVTAVIILIIASVSFSVWRRGSARTRERRDIYELETGVEI